MNVHHDDPYFNVKEALVSNWLIDPEDDIDIFGNIERLHACLHDEARGATFTVLIEHENDNGNTIISSVEVWEDGIETTNEIDNLDKMIALIDRVLHENDNGNESGDQG